MPPFHSRSTGARRIAEISSFGVNGRPARRALRAPRGRARSTSACGGSTPPPGEMSVRCRSRPSSIAAARTAAAARRSRPPGPESGSRKMWRWSNAATSLKCGERSIPLPNTSPDMSPMPTTVSGSRSASLPSDAGVAAHALPGAAGGDAHRLVVVAGAAARGERVAEPEAVLVEISLAMSLNVAVPLSAATTRYGSSPSWRTVSGGCTTVAADDVVGQVEQACVTNAW